MSTTGLFFQTKQPNMRKLSNEDAEKENTLRDGLALYAFMQNLEQLNITEGIFPINSKLPNINMTMKVWYDSKKEEIRFMEKLSYALNLTSTIAYYLGVDTPYANLGNIIPQGVFQNSKTLIVDFFWDLVIKY